MNHRMRLFLAAYLGLFLIFQGNLLEPEWEIPRFSPQSKILAISPDSSGTIEKDSVPQSSFVFDLRALKVVQVFPAEKQTMQADQALGIFPFSAVQSSPDQLLTGQFRPFEWGLVKPLFARSDG